LKLLKIHQFSNAGNSVPSKDVYKHIVFIIMLSMLSGILYNLFSKNSIPLLNDLIEIEPEKNISITQTYSLYKEGRAVFIDTRTEEEYTISHIKNAINVPAHSSMEELILFKEKYPADQLIITYCDGIECSSSKRLAAILTQIGFKNVLLFYGGWQEWQEKDYPIENILYEPAQ
jgi:rhodanese-related sulfurtransferase